MAQGEAVGGDLKDKLSKADSKVKRLESALSAARLERDDYATAYRVLVKLGHIEAVQAATEEVGAVGANEKQNLVLSLVPEGEQHSVAPRDVTQNLHQRGLEDITADYVRTTLWRFAQRGVLKSADGLYWRSSPVAVENVAAPDAETSRADNESTGPATGRGTDYPPTPPEGSIPSGSTPPRSSPYSDDLDDDIPF